ncbi:sensor histidine kinase [Ktedonospora formicarum]|nr:sensor histidine kinase [Ktedonospora formicarum]
MQMKQKAGTVQRWTTIQLLLSHGITAAIIALVMIFLTQFLFEPHFWWQLLLGGGALGCLLGLLFTSNLLNDLFIMEVILTRLVRGLRIEQIPIRRNWPASPLLAFLTTFAQQRDMQWNQEQQTSEYRDQLLQQVAKTAAQEERNRLARDLHDSIKQQIFSVVVSTAAVKARWGNNLDSARTIIDDIQRNAQEAQVEMQALLQQLRPFPLENVGLMEALRTQCQALGYRTGAQIHVELGELPPDDNLPLGTQEMLFRIAQEGFANIARHARASQAWVRLYQKEDELLLEIEDNGQGFELTQIGQQTTGGMGLSNIRERVQTIKGKMIISSEPGTGTKLVIHIHLLSTQKAQEVQKPDQELEAVEHKISRLLHGGAWLAGLSMLALLYMPLQFAHAGALAPAGALVTLLILFFIYFLARNSRTQLAIFPHGRKALLHSTAESYLFLAQIFLFCALAGYYIYTIVTYYMPDLLIGTAYSTIGASIDMLFTRIVPTIFILLAFLFLVRYVLIGRQYRAAMSPGEIKGRIRKQVRWVGLNFLAWFIMVVITFVLYHSFFLSIEAFFSPHALLAYPHLLLLSIWLIFNIISCFQIWSWQHFSPRKGV